MTNDVEEVLARGGQRASESVPSLDVEAMVADRDERQILSILAFLPAGQQQVSLP